MVSKNRKKILVVDDDPSILDAISVVLEDAGFLVSTVNKGAETYKRIAMFGPDLILLDVLMSGTDGREICKRLKANEKTKSIPIVMISAHPSGSKGYLQCGAEAFLAKPFDTEDLVKAITNNLAD